MDPAWWICEPAHRRRQKCRRDFTRPTIIGRNQLVRKTQVLPFLMVFGVFISLPVTETESSGKVSVKDRSSPSPCIEIRLALSTVGCLAVHRSPISRIDRYSGNPLWGRCWPRFCWQAQASTLAMTRSSLFYTIFSLKKCQKHKRLCKRIEWMTQKADVPPLLDLVDPDPHIPVTTRVSGGMVNLIPN